MQSNAAEQMDGPYVITPSNSDLQLICSLLNPAIWCEETGKNDILLLFSLFQR